MRKTWWTLGSVVALSLAACGGNNGGGNNGGGNDAGTGTEVVCTGTFSGAVTGKVKFCSLEAATLANGQLQYSLQIEPEEGSGTIESSDTLLLFMSGDPKTGTYSAGNGITQALGGVESTDGKRYSVQLSSGSGIGAVTLTIDSVPAGKDSGGNTLYEWFGGKAQIQYAPPEGSDYSGTVNLSLDFKPQS
ncbi:hypothetical protein JQX13_51205 [Archangium violaceum]|uniref:hypothetical protein n=1 Tax=Archangium violaceum TaxID=83451 RepID=UPI00193C5BDD|nr:hypothetical protein [Archangium violaceum]QRK08210.1 hypothetical protein JQX13_51205 [Archangium violaceum]